MFRKTTERIERIEHRITSIQAELSIVEDLRQLLQRQYDLCGSVTLYAGFIMPGDLIAGRRVISVESYYNLMKREETFVIGFENGDTAQYFKSTLVLVNRPDMMSSETKGEVHKKREEMENE